MKQSNNIKTNLLDVFLVSNSIKTCSKKVNIESKYLLIFTITSIFFTMFHIKTVNADDLSSPSFEVKMGTINITGRSKT